MPRLTNDPEPWFELKAYQPSDEPQLIRIVFASKKWDKPMKKSLGYKVRPDHFVSGVPIKVKGSSDHIVIQSAMQRARNVVRELWKELGPYASRDEFSAKYSKAIGDEHGDGDNPRKDITLQKFVKDNITLSRMGKRLYNFIRLLDKSNGYEVRLSKVDIKYRMALGDIMVAKNKSNNYIFKLINVLKQYLKEAREQNLYSGKPWKHPKWAMKWFPKMPISLRPSEIMSLITVELPKKMHQEIRDAMVICIFTGMRFSDYDKIAQDSVFEYEGKPLINVLTQKTSTPVPIPLFKPLYSLLVRRDWKMPRQYTNQVFNREIKVIAKLANLDREVVIPKKTGGVRRDEKKLLHDVITSHIGRHSFISIGLSAGIPLNTVQLIVGHSTPKQTLKYYDVGNMEAAIAANSAAVWKGFDKLE